jgi:hypothetical protein
MFVLLQALDGRLEQGVSRTLAGEADMNDRDRNLMRSIANCERLQADLAALREELAELSRYKNLYEQSEKTLDRVHCMYAKRLLEATGERQTVLIPDEEFVKYFEEIKGLKQRLADAEQRNAVTADLLRLIRGTHGTMLLTDPPQDPWKYHQIAAKIEAALKPTESGAAKS